MSTIPIKFFGPENPLSNFYPCHIVLKDREITLTFSTSEHMFQWQKFNYPGADHQTFAHAERVRLALTPKECKRLASKRGTPRGVAIRPDWDDYRVHAMEVALLFKFWQNDTPYNYLLDTGNTPLIEDSPRDKFWGGRGNGRNVLGQLLTALRLQLRMHEEGRQSLVPQRLREWGVDNEAVAPEPMERLAYRPTSSHGPPKSSGVVVR